MPMNMIRWRTDTLSHAAGGKNGRRIGCDLSREMPRGVNLPSDLFASEHVLGAPLMITRELRGEVDRLARGDPRLAHKYLARILEESSDLPSVSKSAIHKTLRSTGPGHVGVPGHGD
jgi:hypothetical protein